MRLARETSDAKDAALQLNSGKRGYDEYGRGRSQPDYAPFADSSAKAWAAASSTIVPLKKSPLECA